MDPIVGDDDLYELISLFKNKLSKSCSIWKKLCRYHSNACILDNKQELSLIFNCFAIWRMHSPQKLVSWAVASTISDYARSMKDISLHSLSYHGTHDSASSVRQYISK